MASTKISGLTALTVADNDDVFPVVDTSTSTTKKITTANLRTSLITISATEPASAATNDLWIDTSV